MIKKSDIGKEISIRGDKFMVLDFRLTIFSDMGCGPVIDICKATLQCVDSGEILNIEWED